MKRRRATESRILYASTNPTIYVCLTIAVIVPWDNLNAVRDGATFANIVNNRRAGQRLLVSL
jgi:hypothetical protein